MYYITFTKKELFLIVFILLSSIAAATIGAFYSGFHYAIDDKCIEQVRVINNGN